MKNILLMVDFKTWFIDGQNFAFDIISDILAEECRVRSCYFQ